MKQFDSVELSHALGKYPEGTVAVVLEPFDDDGDTLVELFDGERTLAVVQASRTDLRERAILAA